MQHDFPLIRGEYVFNFPLKDISFLKTGGTCDILFYPKDITDLVCFYQNKPSELPDMIIGNLSNTIIPDEGIRGCVINLSKFMTAVRFVDEYVEIDAGANLSKFIKLCVEREISSCEKLFAIPGTVGGAVVMNAGTPDFEICNSLISVTCFDTNTKTLVSLQKSQIGMTYRNGNIAKGFIVISAIFKTLKMDKVKLKRIIKDILIKRQQTQPIGEATCGSTFKNPPGHKAWKLIKDAECAELSVGGASISKLHANFLINSGNATSSDFVKLINIIKNKVYAKTGILLEEEIIIL
jgi:UDP-N-acetylmuramate dehydrogenase